MFVFEPKTDQEIHALMNPNLLPDGNYDFVVKDIIQRVSQAQNPMLEVKLQIMNPATKEIITITDYLLATGKMIFKFKHFCEALNLQKEYLEGKLEPAVCIGRGGIASIGIDKGQMRSEGKLSTMPFPDKNKVKDYIKNENVTTFIDDDIKF